MFGFFLGLGLMCASTLMYEIVLTRLLSVTCWYYLAFVSVSMAMFGMTAGALAVQLRPALFERSQVRVRMAQASFAMAVSMPIVLTIMFAIPLDISFAVQTLASFLIFFELDPAVGPEGDFLGKAFMDGGKGLVHMSYAAFGDFPKMFRHERGSGEGECPLFLIGTNPWGGKDIL